MSLENFARKKTKTLRLISGGKKTLKFSEFLKLKIFYKKLKFLDSKVKT